MKNLVTLSELHRLRKAIRVVIVLMQFQVGRNKIYDRCVEHTYIEN